MNASLWWCSFVDVNNASYPTSLITFHERPTDGGPDRCLMKLSAHSVSRSHECIYGIFRSVNSGILWPFELHSVEWTRPCCSTTSLIVPPSRWRDRNRGTPTPYKKSILWPFGSFEILDLAKPYLLRTSATHERYIYALAKEDGSKPGKISWSEFAHIVIDENRVKDVSLRSHKGKMRLTWACFVTRNIEEAAV